MQSRCQIVRSDERVHSEVGLRRQRSADFALSSAVSLEVAAVLPCMGFDQISRPNPTDIASVR